MVHILSILCTLGVVRGRSQHVVGPVTRVRARVRPLGVGFDKKPPPEIYTEELTRTSEAGGFTIVTRTRSRRPTRRIMMVSA